MEARESPKTDGDKRFAYVVRSNRSRVGREEANGQRGEGGSAESAREVGAEVT